MTSTNAGEKQPGLSNYSQPLIIGNKYTEATFGDNVYKYTGINEEYKKTYYTFDRVSGKGPVVVFLTTNPLSKYTFFTKAGGARRRATRKKVRKNRRRYSRRN